MENAAKKLNLPKRSDRYLRCPDSAHHMRLPTRDDEGDLVTTPDGEPILRAPNFSDLMLFSLLYSFSHMKNKPNETCKRSYSEIEAEIDFVRSTIAESVWAFKGAGIIEQIKHFHEKAEYKCVGFPKDEFYITFEGYLFTDKFYVPEEERERKLHKWEIWLISLLGAMCNKPEAKGCDFTIEELCKKSGACEKTIRTAICKTINMGFISSRNRIKYARADKRLHFNVNSDVRRLMKHESRLKAAEKRAEKARKDEELRAANMRAERESYYASLQNAALALAEHNRRVAEKDVEFKRADTLLRAGEIELARAEVYAPETLREIKIRIEQAQRDRAHALTRLKLTEEDLKPQWTCKKCSDSGFLPNGKMCDCYTPPGGDP